MVGGVGLAPAVFAGSSLCAAKKVCIYDHADWVGLLGSRTNGGGAVNVASNTNDMMSSWENKTTGHSRWYSAADSSGTCRSMWALYEFNFVGSADSDRLTSWATNGAC